ncbi:MAG: BON domain-containing protein [Leptolyngbya sp. SIO3F4]|nr:BON domain-containing protein [Leptolyngbya sp. SIO3F4]
MMSLLNTYSNTGCRGDVMDGLAIATPLLGACASEKQLNNSRLSKRCSWFSSIPPERKGLHGEYDYYGLSKRVSQCLENYVSGEFIRLKVRQRGRVVVLSGQLGAPYELTKIVDLVLAVDGVDEVETDNVRLPNAC